MFSEPYRICSSSGSKPAQEQVGILALPGDQYQKSNSSKHGRYDFHLVSDPAFRVLAKRVVTFVPVPSFGLFPNYNPPPFSITLQSPHSPLEDGIHDPVSGLWTFLPERGHLLCLREQFDRVYRMLYRRRLLRLQRWNMPPKQSARLVVFVRHLRRSSQTGLR